MKRNITIDKTWQRLNHYGDYTQWYRILYFFDSLRIYQKAVTHQSLEHTHHKNRHRMPGDPPLLHQIV
jgi:hypothetical protein